MDTVELMKVLIEKDTSYETRAFAICAQFNLFNEAVKNAAEISPEKSHYEFIAVLAGGNTEIPEAVCEHARGIMYRELKEG